MRNLGVRDDFFRDLFDFRHDFDHMFNRLLTGTPTKQLTSGHKANGRPRSSRLHLSRTWTGKARSSFVAWRCPA